MVARLTVVSSDITDQDLVSVDPAVNAQYIALVRRHDPEAAEVANGLVVYLVYLDAAANEIVSAGEVEVTMGNRSAMGRANVNSDFTLSEQMDAGSTPTLGRILNLSLIHI